MKDSLLGKTTIQLLRYRKKPYEPPKDLKPEPVVDIAAISAIGYHYNMRRKENEAFTTSLYEIDRLLEEHNQEDQTSRNEEQEAWQEAARRVTSASVNAVDGEDPEDYSSIPLYYADYKAAFLERASNILPPYRSYDYEITLEKDNNLGYSPLYKITASELETVKQYLLDNLEKGFIKPS
jgi:hypothetical protein